ncbi:MAG: hypothetical protein ACJAVK_002641 [Akkermansiaceae bacterium]|jgi:hypothetical protein
MSNMMTKLRREDANDLALRVDLIASFYRILKVRRHRARGQLRTRLEQNG